MHSSQLRKHFSFKELTLLVSGLSLFAVAGRIHQKTQKPVIEVTKQDTALNINRNVLLFLSMGNKRLIADTLWVQTLLESDESHYSKKDLNSWMYLRFLNIAILDPKFYENTLWGGMYLSIVKDDVLGAAHIFEIGLDNYPEDYRLNYFAGFNYYYEIGDLAKGSELLTRIQDYPQAPPFLKSLVNKLRFEVHQDYETAMEFLKVTANQSKDVVLKQKLEGEIYALKAQMDLECLNSNRENCSKIDADGSPYLFKDGVWKAQTTFKPYRLKTKNEK